MQTSTASTSSTPWQRTLLHGLVSGTLASLASAAVLAIAGRGQDGHAAAPINAVSHWVWPRRALVAERPSWKHTLTGLAIHQGAGLFWGVLYARLWGERVEAHDPARAMAGAVVASSVAAFADFALTPDRFTPGYEHRVSTGALVGAYAAFAVGLAAGSLLLAAQEEDPDFIMPR